MPLPIIIVVQWLHVLLGIFWFGTVLYVNAVLVPALMSLPMEKGQAASGRIVERSDKVLAPVTFTVVILGVLRGTVFGHLHSLDDILGSAYGVTWLIALLTALALITWTSTVLSPALKRMTVAKTVEQFHAHVQHVRALALTELAFFAVIFTCMILMRFGL